MNLDCKLIFEAYTNQDLRTLLSGNSPEFFKFRNIFTKYIPLIYTVVPPQPENTANSIVRLYIKTGQLYPEFTDSTFAGRIEKYWNQAVLEFKGLSSADAEGVTNI